MLTELTDDSGRTHEVSYSLLRLVVQRKVDCIIGGDYDGIHCMAALSFDVTKRGKMMALVQFDEANKLFHPLFEEELYAELQKAGCVHIAKFVV